MSDFRFVKNEQYLKMTFCVACEVCSTHRDHDSVSIVVDVFGVVVVIRGVTRLVSDQIRVPFEGINQFHSKFTEG